MDVELLAARYPRLWHMAEDGSLPGIRRHGLLSTSALLDLYGIEGERREEIESRRRPEIQTIEHLEHGRALIRDNKPMQEKALEKSLTDLTTREWYETLNHRVFFWVEPKRLQKLLGARAYRDRPHLVLEVDTAKLLERHAGRVTLSPINSGATFPMNPAPRGPETFKCIAEHDPDKPIVELAVDYAVPDIQELILSVSRWHGTEKLETLFD